jgi:hypothetical protein
MSDPVDLVEISLQILFGFLGFILALAAIHYRDSLCTVLLRRWRERPTIVECKNFKILWLLEKAS